MDIEDSDQNILGHVILACTCGMSFNSTDRMISDSMKLKSICRRSIPY